MMLDVIIDCTCDFHSNFVLCHNVFTARHLAQLKLDLQFTSFQYYYYFQYYCYRHM